MSASRRCSSRCKRIHHYLVVTSVVLCSVLVRGGEPSQGCDREAVITHVREQFRIYGPRSRKHEYFGFIFRVDGELGSAIVRSSVCRGPDDCMIDTKQAAERIPAGAKVLGEWHTHPHNLGVGRLSIEDVRGAEHNAPIRCYTPFYAASNGRYYTWDPRSSSVPVAMARRTELGNYWHEGVQSSAPMVASADD
jgi:hypothetical protein